MNWLNKLDDVLNPKKSREAQRDGGGDEDSETSRSDIGESSALLEEVPHERLFVRASKPIDMAPPTQAQTQTFTSNPNNRPKKYPGVVRRIPVASRRRSSETSKDVVASTESHTDTASSRESASNPEVANGVDASNDDPSWNGELKSDVSMGQAPAETSFPRNVIAEETPWSGTSPTEQGHSQKIELHTDARSSLDKQESPLGIPEDIHTATLMKELDDDSGNREEKEVIPLERHVAAASTPASPLSRHRPTKYPGAVRRTRMLRRRQSSDVMCTDSEESDEPIEVQVSNFRSQTGDADMDEPSIVVDTSKDVDQAPITHDSSDPGLSLETPPQTDSHTAPIHNSHLEASADQSARTKPLTVQAESVPCTSIPIPTEAKVKAVQHIADQHNDADAWHSQYANLSDATTSTSMMGPAITEPNTKTRPHTLTEYQVPNPREKGLSHETTEGTGLNVTSSNTLVEVNPCEEGLSLEATAATDLGVTNPKTLAETNPREERLLQEATEATGSDVTSTKTLEETNPCEAELSHEETAATDLGVTSPKTLAETNPRGEGLSHEATEATGSDVTETNPCEAELSHEETAVSDLGVTSPKTLAEAQVQTPRDEGSCRQATAATSVDATSVVSGIVTQTARIGEVEYPADEEDGEADYSMDGEDEQGDATTPAQSIPQNVEFRSDFEVERLLASWEGDLDGSTPFESRLNCYGIVHVRILRAQRLPCSVGSAVQAVISLKPWKGRIRTEKSRAFSGQLTSSSVCAQWDEDESSPLSMVHAYSSEESPVPSIHVALVFNPLGVFEFTMCSLTLSCRPLMRDPLVSKRQWLVAQLQEDSPSAVDDRLPLIQIEATFEPADSIEVGLPDPADELEAESAVSVDRSLVEEEARLSTASMASIPKVKLEEPSRSDVSFSLDSQRKGQRKAVPSKPHMLRLIKFWTPASCCVCNQSIASGLWTKKAYHCEECGVDCCSDCQLHVDIQLSCGSDFARLAVEKSVQKRFTLSNMLHFVAPVDESLRGKLQEETAPKSTASVSKEDRSVVATISRVDEEDRGIGTLKLNFVQAQVFEDHLPAETDHNTVIDRKGARFRSGDYYIRIAWTGTQKTARTRTIQGTGRPRFESGEMCFNV
jgi:hypothetical protein